MKFQPTIRVITDEVAIIDCLVDHGEMFKKFDQDKVASFLVNEDFHLAFYFVNSSFENRFVMYAVDNFSENEECMSYLLNHINEQIKENNNTYIMKHAKSKVLDMLYMTDTFRALFGKKQVSQEGELLY